MDITRDSVPPHKKLAADLDDSHLYSLDLRVSLCRIICFRVFDVATRSHADLPTCYSLRFDGQPGIASHFKCGVPLDFE